MHSSVCFQFLNEEKKLFLKQKMRLLVVCLSQSWGGLEKVAFQDAWMVAKLGFSVSFLCLRNSPIDHRLKEKQLQDKQKIQSVCLDFKPRNFLDFRLRREILRLIASGINIVHLHQPSLLGSISPWLFGFPQVAFLVTRHIMNNHSKKDCVHKALYARIDAYMVMSQALYENVLTTHAIHPKNLKIVHLGIDLEDFNPSRISSSLQRKRWGIEEGEIVFALVGRIDPAKGHAIFINAASDLIKKSKTQQRMKFVLVGEETRGSQNHYLQELKKWVFRLGLEKDVLFLGYQENIPEIMAAIDILVMPSYEEAFGLVAIEAMAMEKACIVSSGGSAQEVTGDGKFGWIAYPKDGIDLQKKMQYLLMHSKERIEVGKKARQYVCLHYDQDKRIAKTLEIYRKALKRRMVKFRIK